MTCSDPISRATEAAAANLASQVGGRHQALRGLPERRGAFGRLPGRDFVWFCVAGGLGLLVDLAVLYALKGALGLYAARALSFWAAASTTWAFNRRVTFAQGRRIGLWREYAAYLAAMLLGGGLNYAVYAVCVASWPLAARQPAIAVVLGVGAGLVLNFLSARRLMGGRAGGRRG